MRLLSIVVASSATASFLAAHLADAYLDERVALLGPWIGLFPAQNRGIAFGISLPLPLLTILIPLALIAVACAAVQAKTPWSRVAFGLILGGAIGNIFDRFPDGTVTDFIQVGAFPLFNIADSCITIGAGMLLLEQIVEFKKRRSSHS
jgi:signal peptidase II